MNRTPVLFLNVLVIATCGLVYELLAGTLASYVLGDSVTQFSLIIGIYLSALGAGAWLSRFVENDLALRFVEVELAVAVLGGASAPLLFLSFAHLSFFHVVLYAVVFMIGVMVGLEIPLLMRILKDHLDFKELVARVLAFDYAGALIASLLFPIFLVPKLGLVRTSLMFGFLNACVGLWATWLMRPLIGGGVTRLRAGGCVILALLAVAFIKADAITSLAEDAMFADDIVYSKTTTYQRIVVTRNRAGFQLFLNGNLQFSSADEYRYHEALVHPVMALASEGGREVRRVLVLGGGDGLALREILKYPTVEQVTLVDLDPDMTRLSERFPPLARLNDNSFRDPRVRVVNEDAMIWLEHDAGASVASSPPDARAPSGEPSPASSPATFDAAIVDFPDPNTFALGKLYTTRFYHLLKSRLGAGAAVSVQSTSPLFARNSFWCIVRTLEASGLAVRPYYTAVPSFGVWGFALARREPFEVPSRAPSVALKFLDDDSLAAMFTLSADLGPVPVEVNRLDNQSLVRYYETEWRRYE
jgi:spermidine synthase